jgi:imidazolonepropionase-like amidohydrolase
LRTGGALVTVGAMPRAESGPSDTTIIAGATVLAGEELAALTGQAVVIEGETIARVGPVEGSIREEANLVDATGLTLVPGFIDAHVHIGLHSPQAVVAGGVTTVRDLGWPPGAIWPLVAESRAAGFAGPAVLAVGPILTAPRGYPTRAGWAPPGTGLEVPDPAAAGAAIDRVRSEGAVAVKIALNPPVGPVFDGATLRAITTRAHEHGLKVTAHVYGLEQLHAALDAHVDELAHMLLGPAKIPDGTIARMVEQKMAVVPTLSIRSAVDRWRAIDNLRRFLEAGGIVVYGTDLGNAGPRPGIDKREVSGMHWAGMSARAIIASATTVASRWLGLEHVSAIEAGRPADLVAIGGRPLEKFRHLTDVRMVWRRGRRMR